jgi:hypothetical protein
MFIQGTIKKVQMKSFKHIFFILTAVFMFISCKRDGFGPLTDSRPEIPVTVSNAVDFRPGPTVNASRAAGNFTIELEIPVTSVRKIKEITKVAATAGTSQPLFGTTGLYNAAPIAGNNSNKITFATSLTEYTAKTGVAVPANNPPTNGVELTRQFYFLITLDNNETIITQQVRVLVVP